MGGTIDMSCMPCCAECPFCVPGTVKPYARIKFSGVVTLDPPGPWCYDGQCPSEDCSCSEWNRSEGFCLPYLGYWTLGGVIACEWQSVSQYDFPCCGESVKLLLECDVDTFWRWELRVDSPGLLDAVWWYPDNVDDPLTCGDEDTRIDCTEPLSFGNPTGWDVQCCDWSNATAELDWPASCNY